jgi:sterol desaturase/sphingolipid hydroxylase (fatty acid hydroxylase superfamily)
MRFITNLLSNHDPVQLWITAFIASMVVLGIFTGFFRARRIQPGRFKWKIFGLEASVAVVGGFLTGYVFKALTFVLAAIHPTFIDPTPAPWWRIGLEFAVFFFVFDTWFYWLHRAMHKEPFYSLVHKLHHKSTSPNLLTTLSVNPLESLINGGLSPLLAFAATLVALPLHKQTMPLIGTTTILMGLYVHAGHEFLPRWWNKTWATKWFITTTFHDQHHKYFNWNFGGFTTIWDYICGTVRKKYESDFDKICERRAQPRRVTPPGSMPVQA